MAQIELTCTGCSKRLRMSDEHLGKTVRCPACKATFAATVERPPARERPPQTTEAKSRSNVRIVGHPVPDAESRQTAPPRETQRPKQAAARPSRPAGKSGRPVREEPDPWQDETEDLWSYDDNVAEDYDDPYAAALPTSSRSRKKKSETSGKLLKGSLFALLILLALGSVGGIGYLAWSFLPQMSPNVVDMTYFPENVQGVARIKLSCILSSQIAKAIEAKNSPFPNEGPLGLKNLEIESMVIGFWNDSAQNSEIPGALLMSPWGLQSGGKGVMVVARLNRSVSASEISAKPKSEYKGFQLYDGTGNNVCWMPDSLTVVMGDEKHVNEAIDRGNREFRFKQFDFADSSGDLVFVTLGEATSLSESSLAPPGMGPAVKLGNSLSRVTRGGSVSVWLSDKIQIRAQLLCKDEPGAAEIVREINEAVSLGKSQIEMLKVNPAVQQFVGPATETLNSIAASQSGSSVTINGEITQSVVDAIPTKSRF